jgi:NAD(P)H dehydrogenase (quinone)
MKVLLLDCHPDHARFASHLLDLYQDALPDHAEMDRIALRDLAFSPHLRRGYAKRTDWEPDLLKLAKMVDECDHLTVAFPMWWGAEPAELKGLLYRLFLPGFLFSYRENSSLWDGHMTGRSADVIVTMDTPPLFLRLIYGNALIKRWRGSSSRLCRL